MVLTGAAALLIACAFDQIYGVSQLNEEVVTGLIETNEEGDRVYVGTVYSGTHWDAVARLRAINPATNLQTSSILYSSASNPLRAVAEDTSDDTVWLLLDNGSLIHRSKDLSYISGTSGFFAAPTTGTLERFCDLEQLSTGHFVATGVYEDTGGDLRGFMHYAQPDPANPGSWIKSWKHYAIDPYADPNQACPRVSHETDTGETVVLKPYFYYGGTTEHRVSRYEETSSSGGGYTYYALSSVNYWTTGVSSKWLVADITAEYGKVVIARQHVTDLASGYLEIFEQTTGVSDDTVNLERARAVDFALWAQIGSDATSVLWWGGREADTGSSYELGVFGFVE